MLLIALLIRRSLAASGRAACLCRLVASGLKDQMCLQHQVDDVFFALKYPIEGASEPSIRDARRSDPECCFIMHNDGVRNRPIGEPNLYYQGEHWIRMEVRSELSVPDRIHGECFIADKNLSTCSIDGLWRPPGE